MPYYEIRDWSRGIDLRRLPETTKAGAVMMAMNCHVTRGGELEKRKAIIPVVNLPAGTKGLWVEDGPVFHVWATTNPPAVIREDLVWHKIAHPTNPAIKLSRVLSVDDFDSTPYVAVEFMDGTIAHYYQDLYVEASGQKVDTTYIPPKFGNGRAVTEWYELLPSAVTFPVASVSDVWLIPPGTANTPASWIKLNSSAIEYETGGQAWARAVASNVNQHVSTPDVYCEASDNKVRFSMKDQGDTYNGYQIQIVIAGQAAAMPQATQTLGGGQRTDPLEFPPRLPQGNYDYTMRALYRLIGGTPTLLFRYPSISNRPGIGDSILVNGKTYTVYGPPAASDDEAGWWQVPLTPDVLATGHTNGAIYTALCTFLRFNLDFWYFSSSILGPIVGVGTPNGIPVETEPPSLPPLAPPDPDEPATPGVYTWSQGRNVIAFGNKVYATDGSILNFSAIGNARQWSPDFAGAGFIDTSSHSSGPKYLTGMAEYGISQMAVFSKRDIQLWSVDPDPSNNSLRQVIRNTGTVAGQSVVQWGNDVAYLDLMGVRTLRQREFSNAAFINDIGIPVDSLVQQVVRASGMDLAERAIGAIEPQDGRLFMAINQTIFVLSFFPQSKIAAWSIYRPGFRVEDMVSGTSNLYMRSGNTVYALGGETGEEYDDCMVEVDLPYLDFDDPGRWKLYSGVDVAARGEWTVAAAMVTQSATEEFPVAEISNSTFDMYRIGTIGEASHISLRFRNQSPGPAVLGPVLIHYQATEAL